MSWQLQDNYKPILAAWRKQVSKRITKRQLEIIYLVSVGLSNKEIASLLNIAEGTVKYHLTEVYSVVKASTRSELMLWAFNNLILERV